MNKQLRYTIHILAILLMMGSMQNLIANQIWFANTSDEEITMRVNYAHIWENKTSRKQFPLSPDEEDIICTPGDIYLSRHADRAKEKLREHGEFFVTSISLILQGGEEAQDAITDIYMMRHNKNPWTSHDRILKVVYQGGGSFDITFNVVVKK